MKMTDCKKFKNCSAPICPLDPKMDQRVHDAREKVCFYLLEYSKLHARANLSGSTAEDHFNAIVEAYPIILSRHAPIKNACKRASTTPSRLGRQPKKN